MGKHNSGDQPLYGDGPCCMRCGHNLNDFKGVECPGATKEEKERASEVNHPLHYGGDTTYEAIKVIEAWGLDRDFCLGNVLKYLARAGRKSDTTLLKDLEKALWYLNRKVNNLKTAERMKVPYEQNEGR